LKTLDKFPISGWVAAGFEPVRTTFERNFAAQGEFGAAIHVIVEGEVAVDLWGGAADLAETCPWQANTLVNVWSSGKGWLAMAMHMLADRGLLKFDSPVAYYWPEFAQNGKGGVLVRHIMTHTAGLPAPSIRVPDEALYNWEAMVHALEKSELFWEPGTKCGYHAATFGWLNGEVLRRITGASIGEFIRSQIADPLHADIFVGLSTQDQKRTADTISPKMTETFLSKMMIGFGNRAKRMAFTNPPRPPKLVNTVRWREAEIPSSNGHASARGLARFYSPLAMKGRAGDIQLLSETEVELASREQVSTRDIVTGMPVRRSLGFSMPITELGDPRPATALGHSGLGGSGGFADPARKLAMGYVTNKMNIGLDSRFMDLCRAVYSCVNVE
jgi:CubicO group peptidase (beta-lactamase class C family)